MNFLFMDESISSDTNIASLTAMYIPSAKYRQLRNQFYDCLQWAIRPEPNHLNLNPPELHGRKLLPEANDDSIRLETVARIVDLIVDNDLDLYRVGYRLTPEFRSTFVHQFSWLGICWLSIQSVTQQLFETELLVPVMDYCDNDHVRAFSGPIKSADIMRSAGMGKSISLNNTNNLAEVFYANSAYSYLTQVVDIVSYLRHVSDWSGCELPMSDFKQSLLDISCRLVPCFRYEEVITMQHAT